MRRLGRAVPPVTAVRRAFLIVPRALISGALAQRVTTGLEQSVATYQWASGIPNERPERSPDRPLPGIRTLAQ